MNQAKYCVTVKYISTKAFVLARLLSDNLTLKLLTQKPASGLGLGLQIKSLLFNHV